MIARSDATSIGFFTDFNEWWGCIYDYSCETYTINHFTNVNYVHDILKLIKR